jgi:hypothetical protein
MNITLSILGFFGILGLGAFSFIYALKMIFSSSKSLSGAEREKLMALEKEAQALRDRVQLLEFNLNQALDTPQRKRSN